jgi:hypothetical protein
MCKGETQSAVYTNFPCGMSVPEALSLPFLCTTPLPPFPFLPHSPHSSRSSLSPLWYPPVPRPAACPVGCVGAMPRPGARWMRDALERARSRTQVGFCVRWCHEPDILGMIALFRLQCAAFSFVCCCVFETAHGTGWPEALLYRKTCCVCRSRCARISWSC